MLLTVIVLAAVAVPSPTPAGVGYAVGDGSARDRTIMESRRMNDEMDEFIALYRASSTPEAVRSTMNLVIQGARISSAFQASHPGLDRLQLFAAWYREVEPGQLEVVITGRPVTNLRPFTLLTRLRRLTMAGCGLSDIQPLSTLTNLTRLILNDNRISDLSPLSALVSLGWLELDKNQISDVRPLAGLVRLRTLRLSTNLITDPSPLRPLTSLGGLDLSNNRIERLELLTDLEQIGVLSLRANLFSDGGREFVALFRDSSTPAATRKTIDAILDVTVRVINDNPFASNPYPGPESGLDEGERFVEGYRKGASQLYLADHELGDISILGRLVLLRSLELSRTGVQDVSPLAALPVLTSLQLDGNGLDNVDAIAHLTHLNTLSVAGNRVRNIAPLGALRWLKKLNLSDNQFTALEQFASFSRWREPAPLPALGAAVGGFTNLADLGVSLSLAGNGLVSVRPLAPLRGVTSLDVSRNALQSMDGVEGLESLIRLEVAQNRLKDAAFGRPLARLQSLTLSGNPVSDLQALLAHTEIVFLDVTNTLVPDAGPYPVRIAAELAQQHDGFEAGNRPRVIRDRDFGGRSSIYATADAREELARIATGLGAAAASEWVPSVDLAEQAEIARPFNDPYDGDLDAQTAELREPIDEPATSESQLDGIRHLPEHDLLQPVWLAAISVMDETFSLYHADLQRRLDSRFGEEERQPAQTLTNQRNEIRDSYSRQLVDIEQRIRASRSAYNVRVDSYNQQLAEAQRRAARVVALETRFQQLRNEVPARVDAHTRAIAELLDALNREVEELYRAAQGIQTERDRIGNEADAINEEIRQKDQRLQGLQKRLSDYVSRANSDVDALTPAPRRTK